MASRPRHGGESAVERLAAEVVDQLGIGPRRGLSRRGLFRTAGGAAAALGAGSLLTGCDIQGTQLGAKECLSTDLSAKEKTLIFSNWPLYIDKKGKHLPTLEAFEAASGINVTYQDDVNGNNEFYDKVRNQLGACETTGRDIFVLTDWMAARVIDLGWIQALNMMNMPNVVANLSPSLRNPTWDLGRMHSVPWQSGLTGIAYNEKYTGKVSSFEELLTRPDLKGKVSLLSEMGDTMAFVLKLTGADPGNFTADEWQAALDKMQEIVDSNQIRRFTGNDYTQPLAKGDLVACEAWSGDIILMQADNPNIKFVAPSEGLSLWSDNMMVPNKATHKGNAEALMNYYYEPEVAAQVAAWVNYICPVGGAQEAMQKVDPSLVDNPLIFPSEDYLKNTFSFMAVDTKTRETYDKQFNQIIGG